MTDSTGKRATKRDPTSSICMSMICLILTWSVRTQAQNTLSTPSPSGQEFLDKLKDSVVLVINKDAQQGPQTLCQGSFVLDKKHISTASHCMLRATDIEIQTRDGVVLDIEGVAFDRQWTDIVVLRLTEPWDSAQPFKLSKNPVEFEQPIFSIHPTEDRILEGVAYGLYDHPSAGKVIMSNLKTLGGYSGLPIVDSSIELIGIHSFGEKDYPEERFEVPVYDLQNELYAAIEKSTVPPLDTWLSDWNETPYGLFREGIALIDDYNKSWGVERQALNEALELFSDVLDVMNPSSDEGFMSRLHYQMGIIYTKKHHDREAEEAFEKAWELSPKISEIAFKAATSYIFSCNQSSPPNGFDPDKVKKHIVRLKNLSALKPRNPREKSIRDQSKRTYVIGHACLGSIYFLRNDFGLLTHQLNILDEISPGSASSTLSFLAREYLSLYWFEKVEKIISILEERGEKKLVTRYQKELELKKKQ